MSEDKKKTTLADLNTIDVYIRETWMLLCHLGGPPAKFKVSCRDINVVLEENPVLIERYSTLICFSFFDKIFTRVNIGGEEVDMESMGFTYNTSPQFFFPDRGKIYTMEEVRGKEDPLSKTLVVNMESYNVKACFVEAIIGRNLITVDLERGDRILDESEIKDLGQKPKEEKIELVPAEPRSAPPEETPKTEEKRKPKILFPITPEKNPVN